MFNIARLCTLKSTQKGYLSLKMMHKMGIVFTAPPSAMRSWDGKAADCVSYDGLKSPLTGGFDPCHVSKDTQSADCFR